ncbi:MAG: YlxR family protein [Chloroflexi bacterium]|nr:YlxR family protein [Chloroflexota bacterium]
MVRQRSVPTRTCVVCRERRQKDELLRIVRTPEGQVVFDRTGRLNGRGAYVCSEADHWGEGANRANRGKLIRALKIEIDETTMLSLNEAVRSIQGE